MANYGPHRLIPLDAPEAWRTALAGVPHDFAHTWEYCSALQRTTALPTHLYSFDDGNVRVVCPLTEREFEGCLDVATPAGFSGFVGTGSAAGFPEQWAEFARSRGYVCGYLALNPILENAVALPESVTYNTVYALDLRRDLEDLFAELDRNRRREIGTWSNADFPGAIYDRQRLTSFLIAEYTPFLQRIGASPNYHRTTETLERLCALDNVLLVGAGTLKQVEAVYAFAHTPFIGTCMFYVHRADARHYGTSLVWYGVRKLKERGVPVLNLGGGVRAHDTVAQAKQRFGSTPFPLRAAQQVYDHAIYAELCKRSPVDPTVTYFPAYRAVQHSLAGAR